MDKKNDKKECYPIRINYLPEIFNQKALKELNETSETRRVEQQKLIDLLSDDTYTADIKFEVDFLHQFLRHSKYDASRAFLYLQKFLQYRRNHSNLFQSFPVECTSVYPYSKFLTILPHRCPDGCVIVLHEFGMWNPNEFSFENIIRMCLAFFLQLLRNPMTQVCGFKIIHDFKDTFKQIRYCTPQNLNLFYNTFFNCVPARYKEVHCINKSVVMTVVWSVLKQIMSEKMRKRVLFHSKPEDLLNHFPSSVIPSQYGGSLKDYHDADLFKMLIKDHGNCPAGGQPNYF